MWAEACTNKSKDSAEEKLDFKFTELFDIY